MEVIFTMKLSDYGINVAGLSNIDMAASFKCPEGFNKAVPCQICVLLFPTFRQSNQNVLCTNQLFPAAFTVNS